MTTPPDSTTQLVDLRPYAGGGWHHSIAPGYVIHRGRVYVEGYCSNQTAVTETLFTGLPAEMRPDTATEVTLYADRRSSNYPYSDLEPRGRWPKDYIPYELTSAVGADGSWVLTTPLPPEVLAATFGFTLVIVLAASWSVGEVPDLPPPGDSLAPFLVPAQFEDVDSRIVVHDNLVHLSGRIRAARAGAGGFFPFTEALPHKYRPAQVPPQPSDPATVREYTTASSPRGHAALTVTADKLALEYDGYFTFAEQFGSSTIATYPPPYAGYAISGVEVAGTISDNGPPPFPGGPRPPLFLHPAGFPWSGAISCGDLDPGPDWAVNDYAFPTCFIQCFVTGAFGRVNKKAALGGIVGAPPDADLRSAIDSLPYKPDWVMIVGGIATNYAYGAWQVDYSQHCYDSFTGAPEADGVCWVANSGFGPDSPLHYNRYFKMPDPCSVDPLSLSVDVPARQLYGTSAQDNLVDGTSGGLAGAALPRSFGSFGVGDPSFDGQEITTFFAPPASQYDTWPPGPADYGELLWRPDDAPNVGHAGYGSPLVTGLSVVVNWAIVPFWETRRYYLQAGDLVDLTGAYAVPWSPGPTPTSVVAGQQDQGIIKVPSVRRGL